VIAEIATIGVILVFTLISFKKNAVMYLSISFVGIYIIELLLYHFQGINGIAYFFSLFACKSTILDWGIITSIYLHSLSPAHIFFNLLIFFLVGMPFERKIGSMKFTLIFLISGIFANIGYSLFLQISGIESFLVGASGAIFGIMGAFLILYPNDEITMFLGPVLMPRVKVKYAVLAFMAVEFLASFMWLNDNVAHGAHVIGAVSGAAIAYALRNTSIRDISFKRVNYTIFEELADTEELKDIYSRIRDEDDEIIRNSWILEFFRKKYGDAEIDGKYVKSSGKRYKVFR